MMYRKLLAFVAAVICFAGPLQFRLNLLQHFPFSQPQTSRKIVQEKPVLVEHIMEIQKKIARPVYRQKDFLSNAVSALPEAKMFFLFTLMFLPMLVGRIYIWTVSRGPPALLA